jgi:hypothetical protein
MGCASPAVTVHWSSPIAAHHSPGGSRPNPAQRTTYEQIFGDLLDERIIHSPLPTEGLTPHGTDDFGNGDANFDRPEQRLESLAVAHS